MQYLCVTNANTNDNTNTNNNHYNNINQYLHMQPFSGEPKVFTNNPHLCSVLFCYVM